MNLEGWIHGSRQLFVMFTILFEQQDWSYTNFLFIYYSDQLVLAEKQKHIW